WYSSFLLNRSESLPQIGVLAVEVSSIAVTTQVYCRWVPSRSAMMTGRAFETIVELSTATSSASTSPHIARMIWRCVIGDSEEVRGSCGASSAESATASRTVALVIELLPSPTARCRPPPCRSGNGECPTLLFPAICPVRGPRRPSNRTTRPEGPWLCGVPVPRPPVRRLRSLAAATPDDRRGPVDG